jgi:DeoR/GlpR family transcriptional regulator of sugar metabolism
MDADERLGALVSALQRDGRVDVGATALRLGTSEMTIRRDLEQLVSRGVARRVRGGAVSLLMRGDELPFSMRVLDAGAAKRRIAEEVGRLIADGEAVLLDSGTTAVEVARVLAERRLTVMPVSLHAAAELSLRPSVRLLMPGGEVRFGELAMVGPLAEAGIAALRFDTAVLTCCGLSSGGEITAHDLGDAAVKRAMIAAAARVILAADSSKFSRTAMAVVDDGTGVDVLVTDDEASDEAVSPFVTRGVEVRRV